MRPAVFSSSFCKRSQVLPARTKASDSAEPFGPEPFGPEPFGPEPFGPELKAEGLKAEGLKAEGLVAGHQSLRKDVMTFFHYMMYLFLNDKYAFPGRTPYPCFRSLLISFSIL